MKFWHAYVPISEWTRLSGEVVSPKTTGTSWPYTSASRLADTLKTGWYRKMGNQFYRSDIRWSLVGRAAEECKKFGVPRRKSSYNLWASFRLRLRLAQLQSRMEPATGNNVFGVHQMWVSGPKRERWNRLDETNALGTGYILKKRYWLNSLVVKSECKKKRRFSPRRGMFHAAY